MVEKVEKEYYASDLKLFDEVKHSDGILGFVCHINDIDKFARIQYQDGVSDYFDAEDPPTYITPTGRNLMDEAAAKADPLNMGADIKKAIDDLRKVSRATPTVMFYGDGCSEIATYSGKRILLLERPEERPPVSELIKDYIKEKYKQ